MKQNKRRSKSLKLSKRRRNTKRKLPKERPSFKDQNKKIEENISVKIERKQQRRSKMKAFEKIKTEYEARDDSVQEMQQMSQSQKSQRKRSKKKLRRNPRVQTKKKSRSRSKKLKRLKDSKKRRSSKRVLKRERSQAIKKENQKKEQTIGVSQEFKNEIPDLTAGEVYKKEEFKIKLLGKRSFDSQHMKTECDEVFSKDFLNTFEKNIIALLTKFRKMNSEKLILLIKKQNNAIFNGFLQRLVDKFKAENLKNFQTKFKRYKTYRKFIEFIEKLPSTNDQELKQISNKLEEDPSQKIVVKQKPESETSKFKLDKILEFYYKKENRKIEEQEIKPEPELDRLNRTSGNYQIVQNINFLVRILESKKAKKSQDPLLQKLKRIKSESKFEDQNKDNCFKKYKKGLALNVEFIGTGNLRSNPLSYQILSNKNDVKVKKNQPVKEPKDLVVLRKIIPKPLKIEKDNDKLTPINDQKNKRHKQNYKDVKIPYLNKFSLFDSNKKNKIRKIMVNCPSLLSNNPNHQKSTVNVFAKKFIEFTEDLTIKNQNSHLKAHQNSAVESDHQNSFDVSFSVDDSSDLPLHPSSLMTKKSNPTMRKEFNIKLNNSTSLVIDNFNSRINNENERQLKAKFDFSKRSNTKIKSEHGLKNPPNSFVQNESYYDIKIVNKFERKHISNKFNIKLDPVIIGSISESFKKEVSQSQEFLKIISQKYEYVGNQDLKKQEKFNLSDENMKKESIIEINFDDSLDSNKNTHSKNSMSNLISFDLGNLVHPDEERNQAFKKENENENFITFQKRFYKTFPYHKYGNFKKMFDYMKKNDDRADYTIEINENCLLYLARIEQIISILFNHKKFELREETFVLAMSFFHHGLKVFNEKLNNLENTENKSIINLKSPVELFNSGNLFLFSIGITKCEVKYTKRSEYVFINKLTFIKFETDLKIN